MSYAFKVYCFMGGRDVLVIVSDLEHYRRTAKPSNWNITGLVPLPECLTEISPGNFLSTKSEDETYHLMLEMGFIEDECFAEEL